MSQRHEKRVVNEHPIVSNSRCSSAAGCALSNPACRSSEDNNLCIAWEAIFGVTSGKTGAVIVTGSDGGVDVFKATGEKTGYAVGVVAEACVEAGYGAY